MKRLLGAFGAVLLISGSAALSSRGRDRDRQAAHGRDGARSGASVKRINDRLKFKRGLADIARDAEEIRAAATRMPSLFPAGSRDGHSEAKPAVWERWPEFVAAARALVQEAEKLAGAARSGQEPAIAAQFRSMTRACSGCHDDFRKKR